jgi:hypothetical protein
MITLIHGERQHHRSPREFVLNFALFPYGIVGDGQRACDLAIDTLMEDSYKDTASTIQLLCDNLTLWAVDAQEDGMCY